jgi:uncharacterized protein (DUF952 family)
MTLLHITSKEAWSLAITRGCYAPPSLEAEGFIHLSTPEQAPGTIERFYGDATDLVLLVFDGDAFGPALRWDEVAHADGFVSVFPHLYRAIQIEEAAQAMDAANADELLARVLRLTPT